MGEMHVFTVPDLPEIRPGQDLVRILARALAAGTGEVRSGDVLCISSKIVSKARGLIGPPERKDALVLAASTRTVARRRHGSVCTRIVETLAGPVLAGAGIDASNAPDGLLLLPEDPDAEARALRRGLERELGVQLGVVLSDTSSRIWRHGVGDIALGASGLRVLEDLRGGVDDAGRPLGVTVRNLADELCAAADLAKGKTGRTPVAVIRGLPGLLTDRAGEHAEQLKGDDPAAEGLGARALNRTDASDWFRRPSLESVWQALGLGPEQEPIAAMDVEEDAVRIERALQVARTEPAAEIGTAIAGTASATEPAILELPDPGTILIRPADPSPAALMAAGALAERIRTALRAEEIAAPLPPLTVRVEIPGTA